MVGPERCAHEKIDLLCHFPLRLAFLGYLVPELVCFQISKESQADLVIQHTLRQKEGQNQNEAMARRILDRKAAVDVSLVVDAFLACFIPLWIVGVCRQIMEVVPILAVKITNAIFVVSFVANSIIYSIRKQAFRESVKNMMRRIRFRCGSNLQFKW